VREYAAENERLRDREALWIAIKEVAEEMRKERDEARAEVERLQHKCEWQFNSLKEIHIRLGGGRQHYNLSGEANRVIAVLESRHPELFEEVDDD
jgi:hypothetical protein